jgi:hypothetical protein
MTGTADIPAVECPRCRQHAAHITEVLRRGVLAEVIVWCDVCDDGRPPVVSAKGAS